MYIEATAVVEGALDTQTTFSDESSFNQWMENQHTKAQEDGLHTQIYKLVHEHDYVGADSRLECDCIQYLHDHRPFASWNDPADA